MNLFDDKINNVAVVEYMYQFNVAKCIKNGNLDDLELKEKIKDFMIYKEKMIEEIYS